MQSRKKLFSYSSIVIAAFLIFANISSAAKVNAIQSLTKPHTAASAASFIVNDSKFNSNKNHGSSSTYIRVASNSKSKLKSAVNLPSQYDLRSLGYVTPVKNQGDINACWAFAANASLESYLKKSESGSPDYDFSENNIINNSGFDLGPNDGGNRDMASAYFVRWDGPVNESDDPYSASGDPSNIVKRYGIVPVKHVQNIDFLPGTADGDKTYDSSINAYNYNADIYNCIKQAVMDNGAVDTSLYMDQSSSYLSGESYYYYDTSSKTVPNHEVTIVGWKDDYSKDKFSNKAPGDGAFICKNSWGTDFGDGGYFYVSYYDRFIGNEGTSYKAENTNNYSNLYQHASTGMTGSFSSKSNNTVLYFANVFSSTKFEALKAVGFYTGQTDTSFTAYLATDYEKNGFANMTQIASGNVQYAGYHTFSVNNPVNLVKDHKFAVIIRLDGNGQIAKAPVDEASSVTFTNNKSADTGEGFLSLDATNWVDATNIEASASICLNAYTNNEPLTCLSSTVSENQTNVSINASSFSFVFNHPIQADSNKIQLSDVKDRTISTSVSASGNVLTITPSSVLECGTKYNLTILKDSVKDSDGNSLQNDNKINFQTESQKLTAYYRLYGNTRYDTAQKLVQEGWSHSNYAVLVTGDNWPDALCATALAKSYNNAPLLLTNSAFLSPQTEAEIKRLGVSNIAIVGGTGAVSDNVKSALGKMGIAVTRIYGKTRYETSEKVAESIATLMIQEQNPINKAIIATGHGFADALSVSSYSGSKCIPILLTDDKLPSCVSNFLSYYEIQSTYVIGGSGVISNTVASSLPHATRLGGIDRFETNERVIAGLASDFNPNSVYLATGYNFPDALSASEVAALTQSPVILTSAVTSKYTADTIKSIKQNIKVKFVLGGPSVVSDDSIKTILN